MTIIFWVVGGFDYLRKKLRLLLVLLTQEALFHIHRQWKTTCVMEQAVTAALIPPSIYVNATCAAGETSDNTLKGRWLATMFTLFQSYHIAQIKWKPKQYNVPHPVWISGTSENIAEMHNSQNFSSYKTFCWLQLYQENQNSYLQEWTLAGELLKQLC